MKIFKLAPIFTFSILSITLGNNAFAQNKSILKKAESSLGTLKVLGQRCQLFFIKYRINEHHAISSRHCLSKALTRNSLFYGGGKIKPYQKIIGQWGYSGKGFESELAIEKIGTEVTGDDWVLLKLLRTPPENNFFEFTTFPPPSPLSNKNYSGYAFSTSINGVTLQKCNFKALLKASGADVVKVDNCYLNTGDSGGPFFHLSPHGTLSLLGVIKAKHSQNEGVAYYVPLADKLH